MLIPEFRSCLPEAIKYAELGLRVVLLHSCTVTGRLASCTCPGKSGCDAHGKHPRLKDWFKGATTDVDLVRLWWKDWKVSNVGIATGAESGIVCLDVDPEHGGEFTLAGLIEQHGPLPATWEAKTGGGGRHIIFRHPGGGLRIGNTQANKKDEKKLGRGLDVRGDGGQFVAPPSLHKYGTRYEWVNPPWGDVPLADLPAWILLKLMPSKNDPAPREGGTTKKLGRPRKLAKYVAKAMAEECNRVANAIQGERNELLNVAAFNLGQLVGAGHADRAEVESNLIEAARKCGLEGTEASNTIASGITKGIEKPREVKDGHQANGSTNGSTNGIHLHEPASDGPTSPHPAAAERAQPEEPDELNQSPHRLAALYLDHLRETNAQICPHNEVWRKWDGHAWHAIEEQELRNELTAFIHDQFRHDWLEGDGEWLGPKDDKRRYVRRVTTGLLSNVIQALAGLARRPGAQEDCWTSESAATRAGSNWISMANGILNVDALLAGQADYLAPHSPDWFSGTYLDYPFDPEADCPKWKAFLARNLDGDAARIDLLQEWFGYCLLPDTTYQRFMMLVGEGANGKSVICAALTALVRPENVSSVPLELFGERFQLTATLGKLVNVAAEIGDIDKAAEGYLKSFVSGDFMLFDRKGKQPLTTRPTARLTLATNNLPRFVDKSGGLWRRLIYFPLKYIVPENERVPGMDRFEWWANQGEVPGIFTWAIVGLARLRKNGRFTDPESCRAAAEEYRTEVNPARVFFSDRCEFDAPNEETKMPDLYAAYQDWCKRNGHSPLASIWFGRELSRAHPEVTKFQRRSMGVKEWVYKGVRMPPQST